MLMKSPAAIGAATLLSGVCLLLAGVPLVARWLMGGGTMMAVPAWQGIAGLIALPIGLALVLYSLKLRRATRQR
jgi:hypothetical protein